MQCPAQGRANPWYRLAATAVSAIALCSVGSCGGGGPSTSSTGRSAPTYQVRGIVIGLEEGHVELGNGIDRVEISASSGAASFALNTPLPKGATYDVRILNDTLGQFAQQCEVQNGSGVIQESDVTNLTLVCARVKSVRLLAGELASANGIDGLALSARFSRLAGVACGNDGSLYVSDSINHTIRRISPTGTASTFAGQTGVQGSFDGPIGNALLTFPEGLASDSDGNLYVAEGFTNTIRKIGKDGRVTTLAGRALVEGRADGPGAAARFSRPTGVAVGKDGTVFVVDSQNHMVRSISPSGDVSTVAGTGSPGHRDGPAFSAQFHTPTGIALDSDEQLLVSDTRNGALRRISSDGQVTTIAGIPGSFGTTSNGPALERRLSIPGGIAVVGSDVYVTNHSNAPAVKVGRDGMLSLIGPREPVISAYGITPCRGRLFLVGESVTSPSAGVVNELTPSGELIQIAGYPQTLSVDGTGKAARLSRSIQIALGRDGNLFISDRENHQIKKVSPDGATTTIAGSPRAGMRDGTGEQARFAYPAGIAVDVDGAIYVADRGNDAIRRISLSGEVETIWRSPPDERGIGGGGGVRAVTSTPDGIVFAARDAIWRVPTGTRTPLLLAGRPGSSGHTDGTAANAQFSDIESLIRSGDDILAGQVLNGAIRQIGANGRVSTVTTLAPGSKGRIFLTADKDGVIFVAHTDAQTLGTLRTSIVYTKTGEIVQYTHHILLQGSGEPSLGPLPRSIGSPTGIAASSKRIYFSVENAILFIDR